MITGKDLLDLGLKPGKWFKDALEHINAHALAGQALHAYLDTVKPAPVIPLLARPVPFHENIRAASAAEQANIDYVKQSMALLMRTPTVVAGAIMPDACPAGPLGTIPVGGVVATRKAIHPGMHSADIFFRRAISPETAPDNAWIPSDRGSARVRTEIPVKGI